MASRREFTFGSMILALTGARAARAQSIPELDAVVASAGEPSGSPPPKPPKLDVAFALTRTGKELHVAVTVTNRHHEPVEIVAQRGSMPGPYLGAAIEIDGQQFELPVIFEGDRRQVFSRAGPIPRFEQIAVNATASVGRYRFQWPDGVPDLPVELSGGVDVDTFFVTFERTQAIGEPAAKAS